MSIGTAATVQKSLITQVLVPIEDLVARGPGDTELTAYPRHLLAFEKASHEP
jgi:hypothetical protein